MLALAPAFRGDSRVLTWLLGIMKRQAYVRMRRAGPVECPLDDGTDQPGRQADDPFEVLAAQAGRDEIVATLDALRCRRGRDGAARMVARASLCGDRPSDRRAGGHGEVARVPRAGPVAEDVGEAEYEHGRNGAACGVARGDEEAGADCANGVPSFARIAARIEDEPSVFEAPAWSVRRSARLAASLAAVQVRVMPRAVLPAALAMAALATVAACFVASGWGAEGAAWWFSALLLLGAALTVCAALSSDKADVLALAMPLGPQTVLLARLATVLGVDALAGLAASAAFAWWGAPMELGMLVSSWLVPLAAVAGASALVAVWANASWAGAVAGAVLVPLVVPAGRAAADGGMLSAIAQLQGVVGCGATAIAGCVLLAAAVATARKALIAHLEAA